MTNNQVRKLSDDPVCNRYLMAIEDFDVFLSDHVGLFEGLDLFKPYVAHIKKISANLENCSEFINGFCLKDPEREDEEDDFDCDYDELEDELRENWAENLEDLLNNLPDMTPNSFSTTTPDHYIEMFSDVDDFFERYFEGTIRKEGFKFYHALRGAV